MYFYNIKTEILHLEGCQHLKPKPYEYKIFETEAEVNAFAGNAGKRVGMCKTCQKKRDKILKNAKISNHYDSLK